MFFAGWYGNLNSNDSIVTITIDTVNCMTAAFMRYNVLVKTNEKIGWVDYGTETTGGKGGEIITVTSQPELESALTGTSPKIVQIDGTIEISPFCNEIDVSSNKTITGIGDTAEIVGGGFRIINADNVIINNLTFRDAYVSWDGKSTDNDAIEVNNSTHVWITHCDFTHYDDGLCDIKNGSDYVTVSWCHFHNHNKVMLIGANDDSPQDVGHLNVTVHHNWFDGRFGNGIGQRLPLGRYGKIHVFNNYYTDVITRGVECAFDGNIVVDNNYFLNSEMPHALVGGTGGGDNKMNASGNIYVNSGSRRDKNNQAFNPSDFYSYAYNEAIDIPVIVMQGAGVKKDTLLGRRKDTETGPSSVKDQYFHNDINNIINVYPNPAKEKVNISVVSNIKAIVNYKVIDMLGKEHIAINNISVQTGINKIRCNVSELPAGTYILRITYNDSIINRTLIKQ